MTTAKKIPKIMTLPYGDGSMRWDVPRQRFELRHQIDGKVFTERDTTQAGAITRRDQRRGLVAMPEGGKGTVNDVMARWFKHHHKSVAISTADGYGHTMRTIKPMIGSRPIVDVTVSDIEEMYATWIAAGLGTESVRKHRSVLNKTWKFALRHGLVITNVVDASEIPSGAHEPREKTWLKNDEPDRMKTHLIREATPVATMSLLMLTTGLRPGEALALVWDDIDLDARRLSVVATMTRINDGRTQVRSSTLKTKASRRTVVLPEMTVAALRRHRATQAESQLATRRWGNDIGLVFTNDAGGFIQAGQFKYQVADFCDMVGTTRITPNGFRHTFTTLVVDAGVPLPQVAKMLGHTNIRMLVETYSHAANDLVDPSFVFDTVVKAVR